MVNQVVIVGRLVKNPEVKKLDGDKQVSRITVAVPRSYKNEEGAYDTDFVDCTLWGNIAQNTTEYCKKGDVIGVKGRVETSDYEEDGKKHKSTSIVAERVTFLSSAKAKNNEDEPEV
jgi:single-strand DNA-binding protein